MLQVDVTEAGNGANQIAFMSYPTAGRRLSEIPDSRTNSGWFEYRDELLGPRGPGNPGLQEDSGGFRQKTNHSRHGFGIW